jgi:hypothetical protein
MAETEACMASKTPVNDDDGSDVGDAGGATAAHNYDVISHSKLHTSINRFLGSVL